MKILLVSDSELLKQNIVGILSDRRPILVMTSTAAEACELLLAEEFDLVLLDLDLLQGSANNVLKDCPSQTFTLVVGSHSAKDRILDAIKAGASDFVLKPLDVTLFRLRIGMAIAKSVSTTKNSIRYGPLEFDVTNSSIRLGDKPLALTPTENALLLVLMRRGGSLVNKQFLSRALSADDDWVSNSAVEVYVHRLRRKLKNSDVKIETVRGLGYTLQLSSKE